MVQTARKTILGRRLVIAACLLAGAAGCQLDGPRTAWRSSLAGESRADCPGRCRQKCVPCPEYQPTVWESWRSGPMAVRSNDQCAEPDPTWLNNLPKPGGAPDIKSSQETIPAPPAKAGAGSTSGLGDGFKLQPATSADSVNRAPPVAKPELGEGFKLDPHAPRVEPAGDDSKPAIKGLETTPEKPMPLEKPAPRAADGDGATPRAARGTSPGTARFEPEPSAFDASPAAQPKFQLSTALIAIERRRLFPAAIYACDPGGGASYAAFDIERRICRRVGAGVLPANPSRSPAMNEPGVKSAVRAPSIPPLRIGNSGHLTHEHQENN